MGPDRRRLAWLVGLLIAAATVAVYQYWPSASAGSPMGTANRGERSRTTSPGLTLEAPDVRLDALNADRPRPDTGDEPRDLFRFRRRAAPVPPANPSASRPAGGAPAAPAAPAPPSVPPIAMRFIGLVEAADPGVRIAILTDGRGLYQGREGDIIEGRYRILRIGPESVDVAYLDGRGRQTIRLSGS